MTRIIASFAAFLLFIYFGAAGAEAQTAQDLVGTWTLASATIGSGEVKMDMYGPDPSGTLMFGRDGHYALVFLRRDLPKLTSNSRLSQTVEESRDITKGSIAHFGTYAVDEDEAGKVLVLRIESSTFPNWSGAEQRRRFSLSGDALTYISPGSSGVATDVVLQRAK